MEKSNVFPIREIPKDVISQTEMRNLRVSQEMVANLARAISTKAALIAERIQGGAWIESGREEFDLALLQVRANRAG